MNLPDLRPQDVRRALGANKQFASVLAVLLLVLAAFPGSPARSLLDDIVSTGPGPGAVALPAGEGAPASPPFGPVGAIDLPGGDVASSATAPQAVTSPPLVDPAELPPAEPLEPAPVCATDALADVLDQVRVPLSELLGQPLPGASVRKLAAISAGCSEDDPTVAVVDLALEVADLVPPTGLDQIDLPDLPGLDLPVPPELVDVLAPLTPAIRDGCRNLATVALLFVVLPPAFSLPFSQSDLIQFLGPTTSLCALFDEEVP